MQDTVWQAILGEVELSVSKGSYVTWFRPTRVIRNKDGELTVGVPNVFYKSQFEKKYLPLIKDIIARNNLGITTVDFRIQSGLLAKKNTTKETEDVIVLQNAPSQAQNNLPVPKESNASRAVKGGINERYDFENFIVGSGSELAYAACQAVAASPGKKYNPLFLYGGVGIGKTHLIQAVGSEIIKRKPQARVVYVTIEQFVQEFLNAIRYKKAGAFAENYRSADVLIIDDIQFIAGKEKTQEEFFHTFNALHQANKQIIISSDRPPKDIPTLQERLLSRFNMGMTIDMQAPDFETRCVILQTKAQKHNIELDKDVAEHLAHMITSNVRELEGTLNQLLAHCEMRNIKPTIEVVQDVFGALKNKQKHVSARSIVEKTSKYFHLPLEDMLGPKRDKEIVLPRQVAMYLLRSELNLSYPKIAHELGRKDHTTALHSVAKIEKDIEKDQTLKEQIDVLRERLYA